jgi:hypothetical protein
MGEISRRETFVAINEAPQTTTAKRASRMGIVFEFDIRAVQQGDAQL